MSILLATNIYNNKNLEMLDNVNSNGNIKNVVRVSENLAKQIFSKFNDSTPPVIN